MMAFSESSSSSKTDAATSQNDVSPEQNSVDVTPPIGVTPPQLLAEDAASGKRGAAWRLLYLINNNDPQAMIAVASLDDDRLAQHLIEFIALGTWAGKSFVIPPPLRTAYARTRLRTLFLPGSGIDSVRSERILTSKISDKRPAIRETAVHLLGILGSSLATPVLVTLLNDPVPAVRLQAAKALGRVHDPSAVPALLDALNGADEQFGSQIFSSLVRLGHVAVPALIERSTSNSGWMRWHCIRALGDIHDLRALSVLVNALLDSDHSIAWMAAKGLAHFGRASIRPVLQLLMTTDVTRWLAETSSYVLREQYQHHPPLKPYLEPVVQSMHGPAYKSGTPVAAHKALTELLADEMIRTS